MARKIISDFSGGITDYYKSNAPDKVAKTCNNLLIEKDRSLKIRKPWLYYDESLITPNGTTDAIDKIYEFEDQLFLQYADKVYKPDGTHMYCGGDVSTIVSKSFEYLTFSSGDVSTSTDTIGPITDTNGDIVENTEVQFIDGGVGNLPSPIVEGTTYYARDVSSSAGSVIFKVSATRGGSPVDINGSGGASNKVFSSMVDTGTWEWTTTSLAYKHAVGLSATISCSVPLQENKLYKTTLVIDEYREAVTFSGNNPVTVTCAYNHYLSDGATVEISNSDTTGSLANGSYVVTVTSALQFTVPFNGLGAGGNAELTDYANIIDLTLSDAKVITPDASNGSDSLYLHGAGTSTLWKADSDGVKTLSIYVPSGLISSVSNVKVEELTIGTDEIIEGGTSPLLDMTKWNNHLIITNDENIAPTKTYIDDNEEFKTIRAGLPRPDDMHGVYIDLDSGNNSYIYSFVFVRKYSIQNNTTYMDFSSVRTVAKTDVIEPSCKAPAKIDITHMTTTLLDDSTYDINNIRLYVYRTINGGTTQYFCGEADVQDDYFYDIKTDCEIIIYDTIYTTDGTLEMDAPPIARYCTSVQDITWYGYIYIPAIEERRHTNYVRDGYLKNRVMQSMIGDCDSCPSTHYKDLDEDIYGLDYVGYNPIVFCKNRIYRLEGYFDDLGSGGINSVELDSKAGCVGHRSIVRTGKLLYWAGTNGFYVTDGHSVRRISIAIEETYNSFLNKENIVGKYDSIKNRISWACCTTGSYNNIMYIYDESFGAFTTETITNETQITSLEQTSTTAYLGSNSGKFYKKAIGSDTKYGDDYKPASVVESIFIPWSWYGIEDNYNAPHNRKYIPRMLIDFLYETFSTITCNLFSQDDSYDTGDGRELAPIRKVRRGDYEDGHGFTRSTKTGVPSSRTGKVQQVMRYFNKNQLRVWKKQIGVLSSSSYPNALYWSGQENYSDVAFSVLTFTSDASQTLTLSTGVFPENIYGMRIYSEESEIGTTNYFSITSRTDDSNIVVTKVGSPTTGVGLDWYMYGNPIEVPHIKSIAIDYEVIGDGTSKYNATTDDKGGE